MCRAPAKTRCSYTSSVSTAGRAPREAATTLSSARVNTLPVGLCGVLRISSPCGGRRRRAARPGRTTRAVPRPAGAAARSARWRRRARCSRRRSRRGLEDHHLVARVHQPQQRAGDGLGGAAGDGHLVRPGLPALEARACSAMACAQVPRPGRAGTGRRRADRARATSSPPSGPSKSGKACPRFTAPCFAASALISEKTVVAKPWSRADRYGALVTRSLGGGEAHGAGGRVRRGAAAP